MKRVYGIDVSSSAEVQYLNNSTLLIRPTHVFSEKMDYYITLDPGVVIGFGGCGPESVPMNGSDLWAFRTRDITPPSVWLSTAPGRSTGEITLSWNVDEPTNITCVLKNGSTPAHQDCPGLSWTGTDLEEGQYTLVITAVDMEGNLANVSHTWVVDTTPPTTLPITQIPGGVSRNNPQIIEFTCDEPSCEFECSFRDRRTVFHRPTFSSCSQGVFKTPKLKNEETYILRVRSTDQVGNSGDGIEFIWTVDLQKPTILSIPDSNIPCTADASPDSTGRPEVLDNIDTSPKLAYFDVVGTCAINRTWRATDMAGNIETFGQRIQTDFSTKISLMPVVTISCNSSEHDVRVPYNTASIANPCQRPLRASFTDWESPKCSGQFTRTWVVYDDCKPYTDPVRSSQVIRLFHICPFTACGRTKIPPRGICSEGKCKCNRQWSGPNCDHIIKEPKIAERRSDTIIEAASYNISISLVHGSSPITWTLFRGPKGVKVDHASGQTSWNRSEAGRYKITLRAQNQAGANEISWTLVVRPSYTVHLYPLLQTMYTQNTPVRLRGNVEFTPGSVIGSLSVYRVPVDIDVISNGTLRTLRAITDKTGVFNAVFHPRPQEYGTYRVSARHPAEPKDEKRAGHQWKVYGMKTFPGIVSLNEEYTSGIFSKQYPNICTIQNDGPLALTAVRVSILSLHNRPFLKAYLNDTISDIPILKPGQFLYVGVRITSNQALSTRFPLLIEARESAGATVDINIEIAPALPELTVRPGRLEATLTQGTSRLVQLNVTNTGKAPAQDIVFLLPETQYISLVSGCHGTMFDGIEHLDAGQSCTIDLLLHVPHSGDQGEFTGAITLTTLKTRTLVPYRLIVLSNFTTNLSLQIEDEYTYFSEGRPLVVDANVRINNGVNGSAETRSTSIGNGTVLFTSLIEGRYEVHVDAPSHKIYTGVILVSGEETFVKVFLQRIPVAYSWVVTPASIMEGAALEAEFKTMVPMPVITVYPKYIDMEEIESGRMESLMINITNHGLIRAEHLDMTFPVGLPSVEFSSPFQSVGYLDSQTSILVPITTSLKARQNQSTVHKALYLINIDYSYICGDRRFGTASVILRKRVVNPPNPVPLPSIHSPCTGPRWAVGLPRINIDEYTARTPVFCNACLRSFIGCFDPEMPFSGCLPVLAKGPPGIESIKDALNIIDCVVPIRVPIPALDTLSGRYKGAGEEQKSTRFEWGTLSCVVDLYKACLGSDYDDTNSGTGFRNRDKDAMVPSTLPKEFIHSFVASLRAVHESIELAYEVLGSALWLEVKDSAWLDGTLKPALDDVSSGGSLITDEEFKSITSHNPPDGATIDDVSDLLLRLNNTIHGWRTGKLEPTDNDSDMISFSKVTTFTKQVMAFDRKARERGYGSYLEAYNDANSKVKDVSNWAEDSKMCAVVRLQIDRKMALTKDAFIVRVELDNEENSPLTEVGVQIHVTDSTGNDGEMTSLFSIGIPSYGGDLLGDGTLNTGRVGTVEWLIVPSSDAALTTERLYDIGGILSYEMDEHVTSVPLLPAPIKIQPDSRLTVYYFLEKVVVSDDPLTNITEPIVSFSLAVALRNSGYGVAQNVRITSAQLVVTDEKGLAVGFKVIESTIGSRPASASLTINLGDVGPNTTKIARWWMATSLRGRLKNYSATFEHTDPLGNQRLSVLEEVQVLELVHNVRLHGPVQDDSIADVLVSRNTNNGSYPDSVFSSADSEFYPVSVGEIQTLLNSQDSKGKPFLRIGAWSNSTGWMYYRFITHIPSASKILKVEAFISHQKDILRIHPDNIWITLHIGGKATPTYVCHIFDYLELAGSLVYYDVYFDFPADEATLQPSTITPEGDTSSPTPMPSSSKLINDGLRTQFCHLFTLLTAAFFLVK